MPKTFPCADTTCRGQTMVDGTPCPKCAAKIAKYETPVYDHEKEKRQAEYEHKQKGKK